MNGEENNKKKWKKEIENEEDIYYKTELEFARFNIIRIILHCGSFQNKKERKERRINMRESYVDCVLNLSEMWKNYRTRIHYEYQIEKKEKQLLQQQQQQQLHDDRTNKTNSISICV